MPYGTFAVTHHISVTQRIERKFIKKRVSESHG